jgi:hypothetical protein
VVGMNDEVDRGDLVFERSLRTDRISLWRWLL